MSDGDQSPPLHRKTVQHFNIPGHAHELTWSCRDRRPLLIDDPVRAIVGSHIAAACSQHEFNVVAFVIMPEHIHLIVHTPNERYDISALLQSIKKPASFDIRQWMERRHDDRLASLKAVRHERIVFQYWQKGPGLDRNVTSRESLATMIQYIHNNPVKRGLCKVPEHWPWSSAGQYATGTSQLELSHGVPRITRLI